MIPPDKIFNLFENEEEKPTLIDYSKTPLYKITMFKKYVLNIEYLNNKIIESLANVDEEGFDEEKFKKVNKSFTLNRAWGYISDVDPNNKTCQDTLLMLENSDLIKSLKIGLSYYEDEEEYERCAHLKKIFDFFEDSH